MAKILDSQYSSVTDGQKLDAADLKQDRGVIRVAVNDNQSQLYRLWFGEEHNFVFNTKADLDALVGMVNEDYAVVMDDEDQSPVTTTLYQYQTSSWVLISPNYSLKGVVTGDILDAYMKKTIYDTNDNGIVDKSEGIESADGYTTLITTGDQMTLKNEDVLLRVAKLEFNNGAAQITATTINLVPDSGSGTVGITGGANISGELTIGTHEISENTDDSTLDVKLNAFVTGQMFLEGLKLARNNTGIIIANARIVWLTGAISYKTTFALASNNIQEEAHGTIGVTTQEVAISSNGFITQRGEVRDFDTTGTTEGETWAEGDDLWLGLLGRMTNVEPIPPTFNVKVGKVLRVHATLGKIDVNIVQVHKISEAPDVKETAGVYGDILIKNSTNEYYENKLAEEILVSRDYLNGSIKESFNFTFDTGTQMMILDEALTSNGYLTIQYSTGDYQLPVPCSIAPTFGGSTTPQDNFFYIPISTKTLAKSLTEYITTEEIARIAFTYFKDSAFHATKGPIINQNINTHEKGKNNIGHKIHVEMRVRTLPANWYSGVEGDGTLSGYVLETSTTELYIKTTSGLIDQLHRQTFEAHDTSGTDTILLLNDSASPYLEFSNLFDIKLDAAGASLSNAYFNLTLFGAINKTGEFSPLLMNLPTGSYSVEADAQQDVDGHNVDTLPRQFTKESGTGFPIARLLMKYSGGTSALAFVSYQDLRDSYNLGGGGGITPTGSEFSDTQFRVFDGADVSKILALELADVSSGVTRTATVPDKDFTFGAKEDIDSNDDEIAKNGFVIPMTYGSAGGFYATVPGWALTLHNKIELLFPDTLTDLTTAVTVSFDGIAGTYKALKYEDTLNEVLVKHTQLIKTEVYYDNTEFMMKGETLLDQEFTFDSGINSIYGNAKAIKGSPDLNAIYGLRLNQSIINGNFDSGLISPFLTIDIGTPVITSEICTYTAVAQNGRLALQHDITSGELLIMARFKTDSSLVGIGETTSILASHSGSGEYETISYIETSPNGFFALIDSRASGWTQVEVDWVMIIPITNTPLYNHTASQINLIVADYFEGGKNIEDFELQSIGVNMVENHTLYKGFDILYPNGETDEVDSPTLYRHSQNIYLKAGTYTISVDNTNLRIRTITAESDDGFSTNNSQTFTITYSQNVYFNFRDSTTGTWDYGETALDILMQLEQGSTATTYVAYNSPQDNFTVIANILSVGQTVRDKVYPLNGAWWKDEYVGYDYNDVLQGITSWSTYYVLTNTQSFYKSIIDIGLDIKGSSDNNVASNGSLKIGNTAFTIVDFNDFTTNDTENIIAISASQLHIRVNKTTYATSGDFETYLQANDVTFVYELADIVTTEIEKNGSLIQESNTTLVQLNNFATEYDITFAGNVNKQVEIDGKNIRQLQYGQDKLELSLEDLEAVVELNTTHRSSDGSDHSIVNTNKTNADASKIKTDFITITQPVDLDDMETDIVVLQGEVNDLVGTLLYTSGTNGLAVENEISSTPATEHSFDVSIPSGHNYMEITIGEKLSGVIYDNRVETFYFASGYEGNCRLYFLDQWDTVNADKIEYVGWFTIVSSSQFRFYHGLDITNGTKAGGTGLKIIKIVSYERN